jgi:hypothetical protein
MLARFLKVLAVCGPMALIHPARADEPLVVPATGEAFAAPFAGADADWKLRFGGGDKPREIPAAELVTWGGLVEPSRGVYVVTAGGGLIVVDSVDIKNEHVGGQSPTFGQLRLPIDVVAGVVLRPPADRTAGDKLLARVLAGGGRGDRLVLDNGDELSGTLTALDGAKAILQTDAGSIEVKLDTLRAVLFDPTLVNRPLAEGLRAVVGFQDGSRVVAQELVARGDTARLKLAAGVELEAPTASIVALQIFGGRATYLSDLKPASYRHIPYLQLTWPYHADRGATGSLLRAAGRLYLKGLGMHSPSRITYDLDEPYRRFEAQVAIDEQAGRRGSVDFRVFVDDGSGQWHERAASGIVRGGDPPKSISVDLDGAKRISLLVDFADRGDELDHANWLDARLVR